ncbi:MAG: hypothetical protein V9H26_10855 [Verrucomicrobiota bacterium]
MAILPPIAGALVVAALALHWATTIDHCEAHDHHAHLCVAHGGAWLARPWAVAVTGRRGGRHRAGGAARGDAGRRAGARADAGGGAAVVDDVRVVESPRRFCFVAGMQRPDNLRVDRGAARAHGRPAGRARSQVVR